jgi:hypothetical protein
MTISNSINRPINDVVNITGTTDLNDSHLYQTLLCTGSSNYTISMPNPLLYKGSTISFTISTTSNALISIDTIFGGAILFGSSESVTFVSNGSLWIIQSSYTVPSFFYASPSTNQTLADGSLTTMVADNATNFGIDYNASTYIATITYPGIYEFNAITKLVVPTAGTSYNMYLVVNGSTYFNSLNFIGTGIELTCSLGPVLRNMSAGDTVKVGLIQTSGASQDISTGMPYNIFEGKRISFI